MLVKLSIVKLVPGAGAAGTVKFPTVKLFVLPALIAVVTGTVIVVPLTVHTPNGDIATPQPIVLSKVIV